MDKNSAIGFGLLMVLLIAYVFINRSDPNDKKKDANAQTEQVTDSLSKATAKDSTATLQATNKDSVIVIDTAVNIAAQENTLENDKVKITFTNQGAYPTKVELKEFVTSRNYESKIKKDLVLFDGKTNSFDFEYQKNGVTQNSKKKRFSAQVDDANSTLTYTSPDGFSITYSLPKESYMIDMAVNTGGVDKSKDMTFFWNSQSLHTEREKEMESRYSQVCYQGVEDGFDTYDISEKKTKDFDEQELKWVSFKRHFFNMTMIAAGTPFTEGEVSMEPTKKNDSMTISNFSAKLAIKPMDNFSFQMFTGPNDYKLLQSYNNNMQEIVPLSYGIFGFIKYINKGVILPLFNWLSGHFMNMGMVIIILTFIIRLLMSPITYKSYVSSAKMKALKPELDELKLEHTDSDGKVNQQTYGPAQMSLYRTAGVSPLGGCLPALLQMPIFFALFSFFPHSIELRQKSFAWATDLSSYDSILKLPIDIPFYGDHVSLFTILFAITSILLALYSMNNATMDQSNPVIKYMPFIMPIMFLGIFNSFSSALTLYYFVSNLITLGLQIIIQKYIIDPDKIRAKILAKKNEPAKESKFMKKMKELQEKQTEQAQTRSQRRK